MNRSSLERITASLVVSLLTVLSLGFILIIANLIFEWDLFTPLAEKVLYFICLSMLVVILSATLINIMLNLSRLANFAQAMAQQLHEKNDHAHRQ